jgi:hypothetical protein
MNKTCFLTYVVLAFFLFACKKPEDRRCWKQAGEEDTLAVNVNAFQKINVQEHLVCTLVQDTIEKVVISGGKNLLNFVGVNVENGLLTLTNENKCSFLRSYEQRVKVEIHFKTLSNIDFEGTEPLTCRDTLQLDWFTLLIRDGAGPVNLLLNAQLITATLAHGYGDFTMQGQTNQAIFNVRSNGYCNTYGLKIAESITVISRTQADLRINAHQCILRAQTEVGGNIYYKGVPNSIEFNRYGSGNLIDDN